MTRGELVSRLERDHARLRGKAAVLRSLALGVLRGDADLGETLVLKGRDLQESLVAHMDWEDDVLLPNLRRGSGEALRVAERIHHEHAGQRIELLGSILSLGPKDGVRGDNGRSASPDEIGKVANGLLELIDRLEQDMATEESVLDALPGSDRSLVVEAGQDQ